MSSNWRAKRWCARHNKYNGNNVDNPQGHILTRRAERMVLSSMRDDKRDKFSARLIFYLGLKGYESITKKERMNIVWEEFRSKATEMTLMG